MLRPFYAPAFAALLDETRSGIPGKRDLAAMEPWARLWQLWTSWEFLNTYLHAAEGTRFVSKDRDEPKAPLDAFMIARTVCKLGYELDYRADWIGIPLHGIEQILGADKDQGV